MWKILQKKYDFVLVEGEPGFYAFGHENNLLCPWGFPVEQCGTSEEIKQTLTNWKNKIDFNNPKMIEIEDYFISVLS